jgi:arsenate reductase
MSIDVYQYPKCGTCRKALKWLDGQSVAYAKHDLVAEPIPEAKLRDLWTRSGQPIRKLFNTSGQSYRNGGFKEKLATMSEDEALAALAADGKLVKRPILDNGESVLIGFREDAYAELLG